MDSELRAQTELKEPEGRPVAKKVTRTGILIALVGIFIALAFFFYNFQFVIVTGESMFPTLTSNQRILV
jgi:signal peptidase I